MKNIEKKGIYKIFNTLNGDHYVGSATLSFRKRLSQHISDLGKNKHRNIHLQRAYNKYGHENFIFVIIEVLDLSDDEILAREQWFLDQKAEYNIAIFAENNRKGVKMTPEQCIKIGLSRRGLPTWNKGIRFSEDSKRKMSEAKKGKPLPKNSNARNASKPVIRNDGKTYENVIAAAKELDVPSSYICGSISYMSKGKGLRRIKGYTFQYLEYDDPLRYITPCKRGWTIKVKGEYLGYTLILDEAKQIRDQYIKSLDKQE